jgi:hypothetical protein
VEPRNDIQKKSSLSAPSGMLLFGERYFERFASGIPRKLSWVGRGNSDYPKLGMIHMSPDLKSDELDGTQNRTEDLLANLTIEKFHMSMLVQSFAWVARCHMLRWFWSRMKL